MSADATIYVKMEQNPKVKHPRILLSDVCEIWCSDTEKLNQCKKITLSVEQEGIPNRHLYSSLDVIERIQREVKNAEITILGKDDMIVSYVPDEPTNMWLQWIKAGVVCLIIFFGSAFAIMTFNRDVDVTTVFARFYQLATGRQSSGFTVLEIGYSIGMAVGILIFYNHFSKRKKWNDPTPLEVEMRQYESNVCDTIVANAERSKQDMPAKSGVRKSRAKC